MKKILLTLVALNLLTACSVFNGSKKPKEPSYQVHMQTTAGIIIVQLYKDVPQHTNNFLKLTKEGFYDGLLFHRVIPAFMIQGGDPDSKNAKEGAMLGNGSLGYLIPAEFKVEKYIHKRGALAAARTGNPEKKSSASQFYIVEGKKYTDAQIDNFERSKGFKYTDEQRKLYKTVGGTPHLDNEYTVYGEVIEGLPLITKIANAKKDRNNRPLEDIKIIKARVIQ